MAAETWKPVKGYEGLYEVSNLGRVKALRRVRRLVFEKIYKERILTCSVGRLGYIDVHLENAKGKIKHMRLSRLVMMTFRKEKPKEHSRHLDGNPLNNRLTNLAWGTAKENHADKVRHGTQPRGEKHHAAKLTDRQAEEIRKLKRTMTQTQLAKRYGVSQSAIWYCVTKRKTALKLAAGRDFK